MLAVLLQEGLVGNAEGKSRRYCRCDSSLFYAAIQEIIMSKEENL